MRDGNFKTARDLFAKEVDRAPYYHEFHFWLANAYFGLGDVGPGAPAARAGDGIQHDAQASTTSMRRSSIGSGRASSSSRNPGSRVGARSASGRWRRRRGHPQVARGARAVTLRRDANAKPDPDGNPAVTTNADSRRPAPRGGAAPARRPPRRKRSPPTSACSRAGRICRTAGTTSPFCSATRAASRRRSPPTSRRSIAASRGPRKSISIAASSTRTACAATTRPKRSSRAALAPQPALRPGAPQSRQPQVGPRTARRGARAL